VLLSVFPTLGAVWMLGAALVVRRNEPELRRTGSVTMATIVDNKPATTEAGERVYHPVVRFTTDRGRTVRAVGDLVGRRAFATDKPVVVVYDPARPRSVLVGSGRFRTYLVGAGVFAVIALVLIGVAFSLA